MNDDLFPELRRDEGMRAALAHADAAVPGWSDGAVAFIASYAMSHREFLCEDIVAEAHKGALREPPTRRAWGPALKGAQKLGYVECIGTGRARTSNLSPKCMWRSRIFEE